MAGDSNIVEPTFEDEGLPPQSAIDRVLKSRLVRQKRLLENEYSIKIADLSSQLEEYRTRDHQARIQSLADGVGIIPEAVSDVCKLVDIHFDSTDQEVKEKLTAFIEAKPFYKRASGPSHGGAGSRPPSGGAVASEPPDFSKKENRLLALSGLPMNGKEKI